MQSARVYRSYLRKLHQQNEKSTIKNQQLEKASLELNDHTRKIASDFCNWVEGIGGEDPSCNISKHEVMDWFAVGIDAVAADTEPQSCNTKKKIATINQNDPNYCVIEDSQRPKKSTEKQQQKAHYEVPEWVAADNELTELEDKNLQLENELKSLPSTNLLKEFKYEKDALGD